MPPFKAETHPGGRTPVVATRTGILEELHEV